MANLYELSSRFEQLMDKEELDCDDLDELSIMHDNIEDCYIERAKYIRNLEAEAHLVDSALVEMAARSAILKQKANKIREWLANSMHSLNIKKVSKSPLFELKVKENPASVDDYDLKSIPEQYFYFTEPKPISKLDKIAIKQDIENGIHVPGARLIRKIKLEIK